MTINIHETITNIMTEDRNIINTITSETYILYPDEGKLLRNKLNGQTTSSYVGVGSSDLVSNYEEIDKEN